jgi:hypothetical protein
MQSGLIDVQCLACLALDCRPQGPPIDDFTASAVILWEWGAYRHPWAHPGTRVATFHRVQRRTKWRIHRDIRFYSRKEEKILLVYVTKASKTTN